MGHVSINCGSFFVKYSSQGSCWPTQASWITVARSDSSTKKKEINDRNNRGINPFIYSMYELLNFIYLLFLFLFNFSDCWIVCALYWPSYLCACLCMNLRFWKWGLCLQGRTFKGWPDTQMFKGADSSSLIVGLPTVKKVFDK